MSAAEIIGLAVALALFVYLLIRAAAPGAVLTMTVAGWLEIALYLAVLTALTPLVGGYMARVFTGEINTLGFVERTALPRARRAARARPGLEGLRPLRARVQRALLRPALPRAAHAEPAPVQPAGPVVADLGRLLQHGRVVPVEHELAVLRRRDDPLLLLPDVRPGGPELRVRRGRHRRAGGVHPRAGVALRQGARQLLRRRHARAALHPAPARRHRRPVPDDPGRAAEPQRLHDGAHR